jgi:oxygen-independent coproporphyrinogen-3 oxidase
LKRLGRIHCAEDISRAYEAAVRAGFDNINLDLIFGLPEQSMEDWAETLRLTSSLKPAHISAYSLIIEEGTAFSRLYNEGKPPLPSEDEERRMYYAVTEILGAYGYRQYEISNYALDGRECRHNIKYWKRDPYIGFGTDSHSFYDNTRWCNTSSLDKYMSIAEQINPREQVKRVSEKEAMEETMFLGLRLNEGVDEETFRRAHGVGLFEIYGKAVDKMKRLGLMEQAGNRVFLTVRGRDVSNYVFTEFLLC